MFGGQDNNAVAPQTGGGTQDDTLNGVADLVGGTALPAPSGTATPDDSQTSSYMVAPAEPAQPAGAPAAEDNDVIEPETDNSPAPDPAPVAMATEGSEELLDLKRQALEQLTPLVDQLEQSPEDKFRTTMMLIQASDNQSLLKEAYEAANAIQDEKVKAQALLDVINEINYFTQSKQQD